MRLALSILLLCLPALAAPHPPYDISQERYVLVTGGFVHVPTSHPTLRTTASVAAPATVGVPVAWNPYALASGYTVTVSNEVSAENFDAGINTSLSVPMELGVQYYLSVTAYDSNGVDLVSFGPLTITAPMLPPPLATNILWTIHYLSSSNLPATWIEFAHSTVTNPPMNFYATSNSLSRQ